MQNGSEKKMPYLTEDTLRTQRVGVYLNDLKERLRGLRQQHDEVILHSVEIIKEINDVSSSLCLSTVVDENNESVTKIKRLINEFEGLHPSKTNNQTPLVIESGRIEIKKLLENFEKLNESQVLRESLLFFKRAKESFEKIDSYLEKLTNSDIADKACNLIRTNGSLREKINMFNKAAEANQFLSCFSSTTSIVGYKSLEEINQVEPKPSTSNSFLQSGYEGDVDSEVDGVEPEVDREVEE